MIPFKRRRFIQWLIVCGVCAAPSFVIALNDVTEHVTAMLFGIAVFVVLYTVISSSAWFERLEQRVNLRRALKFGFGLKLVQSLAALPLTLFLIYKEGPDLGYPFDDLLLFSSMPDWYAALIAFWVLGLKHSQTLTFGETFSATVIEGFILSGAIGVVVLLAWGMINFIGLMSKQNPT